MKWQFSYPGGPVVLIALSSEVNVEQTLARYREGREKVPAEKQALAEVYAEATYLKYRSANEEFGVTVGSLAALQARLGQTDEETLLLLEATRDDTGEPVGALLLRYAWTTDIVIDFVGTRLVATAHGSPPLQNCGAMLVYAAVRIGAMCGAPLVYAETARHSVAWWDKLLDAGEKLIKVATVPAAAARLTEIIAIQGKIIIKET